MSQRMFFNAFVMNTPSQVFHGQWRRPDARQADFHDIAFWIDVARTVEDAKFDAMFFADVSGLHGDTTLPFDQYVTEAVQFPVHDPMVMLSALAVSTTHLGFAMTSNVMQSHPFQFARQMSTLDHLSGGRIAWNAVTGLQENGARNYGLTQLTDHAERYAWADEYVDVVYQLWEGSWDDGALLKDAAANRYADPARVHKIFHEGERYRVEGPHLVAPSPQRTPLLFQAGSSGPGITFAAGNAEAVFIIAPSPDVARESIASTRRAAVELGRLPGDLTFHQGMSFVIGDTVAEARARAEEVNRWNSPGAMALHAAVLDPQGRLYPLDTPLSEVETNRSKGFIDQLRMLITDREPLVSDLGRLNERTMVVGTPETIADEIERWRDAGVDGINVMNHVLPGDYREFGDRVMPELRRRGLAQSEYAEGTLRRKLTGADHLNDRHPAARYRGAFTDGPRSWDEAAALADRGTR